MNIKKIVVFMMGIVIIYNLLGFAIIDDNSSTRLMLHDFYSRDNLDVVVVGTSRVYQGFDPRVFDEITKKNSFNLGTASQTLDGSYYLIKEAIEKNNLQTVYLDVEYTILERDVGQLQNTWIISDYLRLPRRLDYITHVCDKENWMTMVSRLYRDRNYLLQTEMKKNIKAKMTKEYWLYMNESTQYDNYNHYLYDGLNFGEKCNNGYDYFAFKTEYGEFDKVNVSGFNPAMVEYLHKIIKLCKDNEVNIVLFTAPETRLYIRKSGDYNQFTQWIKEISREYDIEYYDFNLIKTEEFSDEEFTNLDHLTIEGAEHFSKILAEIDIGKRTIEEFANNINDVGTSPIEGIVYDIDENNYVNWRIIGSIDKRQIRYKLLGYSIEGELVTESGELLETKYQYNVLPDILVVEILDMHENVIGKAKFM